MALKLSAERGYAAACAYLHRIWDACGGGAPNPGEQYLYNYAAIGARPALLDLKRIGTKDQIAKVERWLSDTSGGVGATWYSDSEMLNGFTQGQWIKDEWCMEKVRSTEGPLANLVVNRRGDSVLHFVASCGRLTPFKALMSNHRMEINLQNPLGETPLLSACRAGQGGIVIFCLQIYKANASIAAHNGETALHWLTRFDDQYIEPMVADLIDQGANINAVTKEQIAHSEYPGRIDMDIQMPGPSMTWAVHDNRPYIVRTLLKHGADPLLVPAGASSSALEMAAYYHHHECLEIIIEHLEKRVTKKTVDGEIDKRHALFYAPIVLAAEKAADKFSMILRGGRDYIKRLHATLDILRQKTEFIDFQKNPSVPLQNSLLFTAVSRGHDEVVEYMLEKQWLIKDRINFPVGEHRGTPVLEAVRWNRPPMIKMLLEGGANIHAAAADPFDLNSDDWTALHVFAQEGHDKDLELVSILKGQGIPIDGLVSSPGAIRPDDDITARVDDLSLASKALPTLSCETPFAVALRRNAFNLSAKLLSLGADPNSLSYASGLFKAPFPTTILGHIILSNARYSSARLRFLLHLESHEVHSIVEPARKLTALHRSAMGCRDISHRTGGPVDAFEYDKHTNASIMYELLLKWKKPEELNAKCQIGGSTALHLAIEACNLDTVEELLQAGARADIVNDKGLTATELAKQLADSSQEAMQIYECLSSHI